MNSPQLLTSGASGAIPFRWASVCPPTTAQVRFDARDLAGALADRVRRMVPEAPVDGATIRRRAVSHGVRHDLRMLQQLSNSHRIEPSRS